MSIPRYFEASPRLDYCTNLPDKPFGDSDVGSKIKGFLLEITISHAKMAIRITGSRNDGFFQLLILQIRYGAVISSILIDVRAHLRMLDRSLGTLLRILFQSGRDII